MMERDEESQASRTEKKVLPALANESKLFFVEENDLVLTALMIMAGCRWGKTKVFFFRLFEKQDQLNEDIGPTLHFTFLFPNRSNGLSSASIIFGGGPFVLLLCSLQNVLSPPIPPPPIKQT